MRNAVGGIKFNCFLVATLSLLRPVEYISVEVTEVVVRSGVFWVELDCLKVAALGVLRSLQVVLVKEA
jgi:hypothetical protein